MKFAWIVRLVVAALALALLAPASIAAAGEDGEKKSTTYAGTVEGADAYIGIVVTKGEDTALVYVCDGAGLTEWFRAGVAQKGRGLSAISAGGAALAAHIDRKTVAGTLVLPGGALHEFTASKAKGDAGLYRLEQPVAGGTYAAGWVVLPDGSFRGDVTRTGLTSPLTNTTLDESTKPPPPPTEPTSTTALPAERVLGIEQGTPAPPDIEAQFPTDPPPDAQVLSATVEGDLAVGDETSNTEPDDATATTAVPLSFTEDACAIIQGTINATFEAIDKTFDVFERSPPPFDVIDRRRLNSIVNALVDLGQAAGCTGGTFD